MHMVALYCSLKLSKEIKNYFIDNNYTNYKFVTFDHLNQITSSIDEKDHYRWLKVDGQVCNVLKLTILAS